MGKSTPYKDLLGILDGESCIGIVLGEMGRWDCNSEQVPNYDKMPKNQVLQLEEAKPFLDYPYNTGFGAPELPALYAWTSTRVISVYQYDGATGFFSIPRSPEACEPEMVGR